MIDRIELAELRIAVEGRPEFVGYFFSDADAWLRERPTKPRYVAVTVTWADGSRHDVPRVDLAEQPDAPLAELLRAYTIRSSGMEAPPGTSLDAWRRSLARYDPTGAAQQQMLVDLVRLAYCDIEPSVLGCPLVRAHSDRGPVLTWPADWQSGGLEVIVSRVGQGWMGWAYLNGQLVATEACSTPGQTAAALNDTLRPVAAREGINR